MKLYWLRDWIGNYITWWQKLPGWAGWLLVPVLFFLLIISKLIGEVKHEKDVE